MTKLTGRTRFRVGTEGIFNRKTVLILEVEYEIESLAGALGAYEPLGMTKWRDATLYDISTSRETGKETAE